jgi:hypothetical protein
MHFAYLKHLVWSSIGYSFLITAVSILTYPLINAIWAKLQIHKNGILADSFSNPNFTFYLANMDSVKYQDNTITSAIKCALAVIVAFGSIIGRVGPLECLILSVVGMFGYELNRNIVVDMGQDLFGSFSVFTFGGFLGVTSGILMTFR